MPKKKKQESEDYIVMTPLIFENGNLTSVDTGEKIDIEKLKRKLRLGK